MTRYHYLWYNESMGEFYSSYESGVILDTYIDEENRHVLELTSKPRAEDVIDTLWHYHRGDPQRLSDIIRKFLYQATEKYENILGGHSIVFDEDYNAYPLYDAPHENEAKLKNIILFPDYTDTPIIEEELAAAFSDKKVLYAAKLGIMGYVLENVFTYEKPVNLQIAKHYDDGRCVCIHDQIVSSHAARLSDELAQFE